MGEIRERISRYGGRTLIGLKTPARKNCGSITNVKTCPAISWLLRLDKTRTPNAPPSRHQQSRDHQAANLGGRGADADDEREGKDGGSLWQGDQGLSQDLANDDRIARDR